jgi:DNA-binding MarR family transcriptional regulator
MAGAEDGDAERDFVVAHCPPHLEATVRELPSSAMHLLAMIAEGPVGVVGLAARSGQLKGTVSKYVQRLVEAGLVTRTAVPGNRKEVQLALTGDGELVVEAHQRLHDEMNQGIHDFLKVYGNAELQVVATVLRDLLASSKDGVRITRH